MNNFRIKSKKLTKLVPKLFLTLLILIQTVSQLHLHHDDHVNDEHVNEDHCITCHLNSNSFIPDQDLNLILISFGILITILYLQSFLITSNQKFPFNSRSPPLL